MGIAPLRTWVWEPSDGSLGIPHAADSRRTTHITASRNPLCSPIEGILGRGATPAGDRPSERPPLLGAFSPSWENQALNRATQHWHTDSTYKRAISVCPRHRVYESCVE